MKHKITINKTFLFALFPWFLVSLTGHNLQVLNVQYPTHHVQVILLQQKVDGLSSKICSMVHISAASKPELGMILEVRSRSRFLPVILIDMNSPN